MDAIYNAISAILLFWHDVWHAVVGSAMWLATSWSWVLAIIFLVVTVRVILFPIFVKQIKSQRAMQALQPKVKALQEKHKGDRETMQKELMLLYREEKANPLMGCLPMFLQIPVFFGLYHVLTHLKPTTTNPAIKQLYGWTVEEFDSATHARLFGAPIAAGFKSSAESLELLGANSVNVKVVAGVLVLIMMVTTYLTQRQMILKTGWAEDPQQKMIQRLMLYGVPVSLFVTGFFGFFPIGVVTYWVVQNLFSLAQQQWVLRKYPPLVPAKASAGTAKAGTAGRTGATARLSLVERFKALRPRSSSATKPAGGTRAPGKQPTTASTKAANTVKAPNAAKVTKATKSTASTEANGATPDAERKTTAPRVGAKPINSKRGGPAKKR